MSCSQTFSCEGASPNSKKDRKKFGLRKKKSNHCSASWSGTKGSSNDLTNNAVSTSTNYSPCKSCSTQEVAESSSPVSVSI